MNVDRPERHARHAIFEAVLFHSANSILYATSVRASGHLSMDTAPSDPTQRQVRVVVKFGREFCRTGADAQGDRKARND